MCEKEKEIKPRLNLVITLEDGDAENKEYGLHIKGVIGYFEIEKFKELDVFIYDDFISNVLGDHKERVREGIHKDDFNTGYYEILVTYCSESSGDGHYDDIFEIEAYKWYPMMP